MTQLPSYSEAGIAPLVIGGVAVSYSTVFWTVANVGLTAYQIDQIWGSGASAVSDAESSARQEDLANCMEQYGDMGGLTPHARATFISDLDNWRAYAAKELGGDPIKLAAAEKTIGNIGDLYAKQTDPAGLPVGACHVLAGSFIISRQIDAMKQSDAPAQLDVQEELSASSTQPRAFHPGGILAIALGVGALSYFIAR